MPAPGATAVGICTRKFSATAYIRLILPLFHQSLAAKIAPRLLDLNKINNMQMEKQPNFFNSSSLVIQRDCLNLPAAEKIIAEGRKRGIKIIYEIDDDLLSIGEDHPEYKKYQAKSAVIKYLSQNADLVTVSTANLARCFNNCKRVYVIKNALDEKLWFSPVAARPAKDKYRIKIGYLGSPTHNSDLELLKEPVLRLKEKLKKKFGLEAVLYVTGGPGGKPDQQNWFRQIPVPKGKSLYPNYVEWLRKTIDWHIGVAPLQNTRFNQSKSELKYLEYTALGLPGIYCNTGAYSDVIKHGKNGLLAPSDDPESWAYSLFQLITDKELQKQIITNARYNVHRHYLLKHRAGLLKKIYSSSAKG